MDWSTRLFLSARSIDHAFAEISKQEQMSSETVKHKYRKTKKTTEHKQESIQPIKEEVSPSVPKEKTSRNIEPETEEQRSVYRIIADAAEPVGLEELTVQTGYSADVLSETLLDLEIEGLIKAIGSRYDLS